MMCVHQNAVSNWFIKGYSYLLRVLYLNISHRSHTEIEFQGRKILKLEHIRHFQLGVFMYTCIGTTIIYCQKFIKDLFNAIWVSIITPLETPIPSSSRLPALIRDSPPLNVQDLLFGMTSLLPY